MEFKRLKNNTHSWGNSIVYYAQKKGVDYYLIKISDKSYYGYISSNKLKIVYNSVWDKIVFTNLGDGIKFCEKFNPFDSEKILKY